MLAHPPAPVRESPPPTDAFAASVRPLDVFLCTYPKSGTTWLGYLLAQLLKESPDEQLGLDSFNRYVPDVNTLYRRRAGLVGLAGLGDPRFMLCHAEFDPTLPRVVYVLRDPRDVMVSYWHYQRFLRPGHVESLAEFLQRPAYFPCAWDAHVRGWLLPRRHPNLLVLRYEDMHADTAGVLRQVLDFAGLSVEPAAIAAAVDQSRFSRMRAAEERFGVGDKAAGTDERFVRKGRVGSWQEEMGPAELRLLEDRFGEVMRQVGYPPVG